MKSVKGARFSIIDIKPGEGPLTFLAFLLSFCFGFSNIFIYATSRALFLVSFDAQDLAYVYIGVAAALFMTGRIFSAFESRLPRFRLIYFTICFMIISLLCFRFSLELLNPHWVRMVLALWFDVCFLLSNLCFWNFCNSAFNMHQAKRLYGIVGTGEFLAVVLAGSLCPGIARLIGAENFLFLSGFSLCMAYYVTVMIQKRIKDQQISSNRRTHAIELKKSKGLFSNSYLFIIQLLWAVSVAGLFFSDLALNLQAELYFKNPNDLAGFFGIFYAVMASLVLVIRGFTAGRIIDRIGVLNALYLLPSVLLAATLTMMLASYLSATNVLLFWSAITVRLLDYIFRYSFYRPAFMVLYKPLRPKERLTAQATVESTAESSAIFLVGALLIIYGLFTPIDMRTIAFMLLVLIVLWLATYFRLRSQYIHSLITSVKSRVMNGDRIYFRDKLSLNIIAGRIYSKIASEAIYSISLLAGFDPKLLKPHLSRLLRHPSEAVVISALKHSPFILPNDFAAELLKLIQKNRHPKITAQALITLAELHPQQAVDVCLKHLGNSQDEIVLGAAIGILRYIKKIHEPQGVAAIRDRLSTGPLTSRLLAIDAIAQAKNEKLYPDLIQLYQNERIDIRKAAVAAMGQIGHEIFIPVLISALNARELNRHVSKALIATGPPVIEHVVSIFNNPSETVYTQIKIIKIMSKIPDEDTKAFLISHIAHPKLEIRSAVLDALLKMRYQAPNDQKMLIQKQIRMEAAFYAFNFQSAVILASASHQNPMRLLVKALKLETLYAVRRIIALISFLSFQPPLKSAQKMLEAPIPQNRRYAVELILNYITNDQKRIIMPLIEDLTDTERMKALENVFPQKQLSKTQRLKQILSDRDVLFSSWTRALAVLVLSQNLDHNILPVIQNAANDIDPLISETGCRMLDDFDRCALKIESTSC